MKRRFTLSLLFALCLMMLVLVFPVSAETSGACGDNLTWRYEDEVLTISGSGEMWEYTPMNLMPWADIRKDIKKIVIESGLTVITHNAFEDCSALEEVCFPDTVTHIGGRAFLFCRSLKEVAIPNSVIEIGDFCFDSCTALEVAHIGTSVEAIRLDAFRNCTSLKEIYFHGDAIGWMYDTFYSVVATAYYPADNETWTEATLKNYGGTLTWVAQEDMDDPFGVKITKQPVDVTVGKGETAKVTFSATGDDLTYKWYYKNPGANKFTYTSSFKGKTYSVEMTADRAGRQVYCVITDKYGNSVTTDTVTLSMKRVATITQQPVDVTVGKGETAKITIGVQGDGLTYKWYYKNPGASEFKLTTSFKGSSYTISAMDATRNGRQVYCVITDKYGNTVTTNTVTLKLADPVKITKQPVNVTVGKGEAVKITFTATGDGLTYKWYFKNPGGSKFSLTTSFKGNTYTISAMDATRNGRQVYCVITDKYGNSVTTDTVTIKMANPVTITKQPVNVTVASGEAVKITVTATGDGLSYKWYYKNPGSSKFSLTSTFKGSTYSISAMDAKRSGRQVYCVITDKYGNSVTTKTVTISMQTPLQIVQQPTSVTVAEGKTATVTVVAEGDGLTYRWYYKNAGAKDYTYTDSFKGNTYSVKMTDARNGRRLICRVYDQYGNVVKSETVIIKMK